MDPREYELCELTGIPPRSDCEALDVASRAPVRLDGPLMPHKQRARQSFEEYRRKDALKSRERYRAGKAASEAGVAG